MTQLIDLHGVRYGRLTVLDRAPSRGVSNHAFWRCLCDCGRTRIVSSNHLRRGYTTSCGCYGKCGTGHHGESGETATKEYRAWKGMKNRCLNLQHPSFQYWGGRGITVCPEWEGSFQAFLAHVGRAPSAQHSLDRIDNNGGYEPGNVRWATASEQARNRRSRYLRVLEALLAA